VGLVPLHANLQVMPTAQRLARAFEVLGDRVDVLDTGSLPVLTEQTGTLGAGDGRARSARGKGEGAVRPEAPLGSEHPAVLERALEDAGARFSRVLVVFGAPGGAGPAAALLYALDGVVLVARSGGATEFRLHKWLRRIEPQRRLGVLFVE